MGKEKADKGPRNDNKTNKMNTSLLSPTADNSRTWTDIKIIFKTKLKLNDKHWQEN